jgi:hypothetical protein
VKVRPYQALTAATAAVALGLALLARAPHRGAAPAPAKAAAPAAAIALDIEGGAVAPPLSTVPRDRRVRLEVRNRGRAAVAFALAGYEDRVRAAAIAPGETLRLEFLADRPGEDFAWLLDGRPGGRLVVAGSHLVDGHR